MIKMGANIIQPHGILQLLLFLTMLSWIHVDADMLNGQSSPPRFKQDILPNKVAIVDDAIKFVCRATGQPKPYITWFYDNGLLSRNERIKITKFSLRISNSKVSDSGKYACRVTNAHGEIWGNFTLTMYKSPPHHGVNSGKKDRDLGPPVFTEIDNMVGYIARAATAAVLLDCSVVSYPKATITWWKDKHFPAIDTEIIAGSDKYLMEEYTLKMHPLTLADSGNYTCIVGNEYGNINHTFKLEVQQRVATAPMLEDVKNQTVIEGENATFTCSIVMSDPHPLLQWLRHYMVNDSFTNDKGEPYVKILQQSGFLRTFNDPQELVLTNVTQEDVGWYTCLVANTVGMNYRSAWLDVVNDTSGPPVFNEGLNLVDRMSRPSTTYVEMDCSARSNPNASIIWWKDQHNLITGASRNYVMNDYKLNIISLTTEDAGDYTCIVSNTYGNISHTYTLEVHQPSTSVPMMHDVGNQTAVEGENVTFTCKVIRSDTPPILHWLRPYMVNEPFTNEKVEPYFKILHQSQSGHVRTIGDPVELVLTNVTQAYEGWYMCLASNANGINYRSAWLEVFNEREAKELGRKK